MLNVAGWSKKGEDEHHVTMVHDNGHEMKILLKKLKPIEREQIKRLKFADGGDVQKDDVPEPNKANAQAVSKGASESGWQPDVWKKNISQAVGLADGGGPQDGKPLEIDQVDDSGKPVQQAPQAPAASQAPINLTINAGQPAATPDPVKQAPPPAQPIQGDQQSPAKLFGNAPIDVKQPQIPQMQPSVDSSGTANLGAIAQNAQSGAGLQRDVNIAQGQGQAKLEKAYTDEKSKLAQNDLDHFNNLAVAPTETYKKYLDEHPINEKHYLQNLTAPGKIMTVMGIILGGAAGRGNGNVAMDYVNDQINRDIQGQKDRMGQAQTIYGAYQKLYGDSNLTNNLAKVSMIDLYDHKAKNLAAQLNTPQAWANYATFSGNLALERQKQMQDSAVNVSALTSAQGQGSANGTQIEGNFGKQSSNSANPDQILHPDAEQRFKNLAYTPKAREMLPAIANQFNQANQADKSIKTLDETFDKMEKNVDEGSVGGNIRRRGAPMLNAIPLVGHSMTGALNYVTDTPANMGYDSNRSDLLGAVSSALKGTNVGAGQIEDIVNSNSPERGDTPELKAQKRRVVKDFIKKHTDTSLLSTWGLTK